MIRWPWAEAEDGIGRSAARLRSLLVLYNQLSTSSSIPNHQLAQLAEHTQSCQHMVRSRLQGIALELKLKRGTRHSELASWIVGVVSFGIAIAEPYTAGQMSWYGALGLVLGVFGLVVSAFFYQLDIWYTQSPQQEAEMLSKEQVALDALILLLTELPLS